MLSRKVSSTFAGGPGAICCAAAQLCVEARQVLLTVLSRNAATSLPAKAAGYAYVAQFAAICRMQHLPPEHGEQRQASSVPLLQLGSAI